ncbi:MAG: DUF1549 domain-containing protein [Gemmataceae bacterium]|nr:DUF1549 domain-containing protein [Gemmataceae bacterium]
MRQVETGSSRIVHRARVATCWFGLSVLLLCALGTPARAASRLVIDPTAVVLDGPLARQQILVTLQEEATGLRDVTDLAEFQLTPAGVVALGPAGLLLPRKDGAAVLRAGYNGQEASLRIEVRGMAVPPVVSFRHFVEAVLAKAGCNAGTCHGSPSGKNGFRLSLRGSDPGFDHLSLTRDVLGRRINPHQPETSLVLLKALGQVPHGGGRRLESSERLAAAFRQWIAAGAADDAATGAPVPRLEVLPKERELRSPADRQQLLIRACFSDGTIRDVTDLAVYSLSDERVAEVSETGLIRRRAFGETSVLVRYLDQMATAQLAFLPEVQAAWTLPPVHNFVDALVFAKLKRLGLEPSPLCGDEEFGRRAALDTIGTVLPPEVARAFLDSKEPNKRARLVDLLLERPEYADFWALKWSDVLRAGRPNMALSEVIKLQRWLRRQLAEYMEKNKPASS